MGLFSFLGFGSGQLKNALRRGAIIIDVRTPQEYDQGHIPDAFNIPVDRINVSAARIKASKLPVVLCCNSGTRSSIALYQLKAKGIKEVYNGGSWQHVMRIIQRL